MSVRIGAVVLAAGLSRRMGAPKQVLPWGGTTVIGRVVQVLALGGAQEIRVVTGGAHDLMEAALRESPAQVVFNSRFAEDAMILSLQTGLGHLPEDVQAALVALGDQPQIQPGVVQALIAVYRQRQPLVIVPSYQMRRGHPWLIDRSLWGEILQFEPAKTLRDVLNWYAEKIFYLTVDTDTVLRDLDTPEDYRREKEDAG